MHPVSGELYWNLKLEIENEKKKVLEFEQTKTQMLEENNQLNEKLIALQKGFNEQKEILNQYNQRKYIEFMTGRWILTYTLPDKSTSEEELEITHEGDYLIKDGNDW